MSWGAREWSARPAQPLTVLYDQCVNLMKSRVLISTEKRKPTEKEILAAYRGVWAASEVINAKTQLLLAPRLPVLG